MEKKMRKRMGIILALAVFWLSAACVQAVEGDGIYTPDGFSWSGGTGKVEISCDKVEIADGQAYAEIIFSSSYYEYVKVYGEQYDAVHENETSVFTIPVELNVENTILAMTTRMSTSHEIKYTICVLLGEESGAAVKESGTEEGGGEETEETAAEEETAAGADSTAAGADSTEEGVPEIAGLTFESVLELDYAECFDVYYYEGGYALIDVHDSARYLVVPEGLQAPAGIDESIVILQKPLDHIYLAATAAMALFDALDSLDAIRLSGTNASGWYIDHAVEAMEAGEILFAGKYSEPDYELLVKEDCTLAIESTMILHSPKVKEMIEMLGIPVFLDYSSYEEHPLGRTEWIKLYGVLMDKEEEAKAFFDEQAKVIEELKDFQNTEKTVAFFYVNMSGSVVVRGPEDYIPKMIELAGGRYASAGIAEGEGEGSRHSSLNETMEEFCAQAVNADYLIYNSTIDNPLGGIDDLLAKSELFADFKAVKEGNVWCTGKYLYQATDIVGNLITDIHLMLTGDDGSGMTFLYKVE